MTFDIQLPDSCCQHCMESRGTLLPTGLKCVFESGMEGAVSPDVTMVRYNQTVGDQKEI